MDVLLDCPVAQAEVVAIGRQRIPDVGQENIE
jgi:hypothetical protein